MAERMAKTFRILKSKKFFVAVYLLILSSITLLIGSLIYIYVQDQSLYSTDIEKYDDYNKELDDLQNSYTNLINQINIENQKLEGVELNEKNIVENLLTLHNRADGFLQDIIEKNNQILSLSDIKEDDKIQAALSVEVASNSRVEHENSIQSLKRILVIIDYKSALKDALECYQKIDTQSGSDQIAGGSRVCNEKLDVAYATLSKNEVFNNTRIYHSEIKNYWDITVRFNLTAENRDQEGAEELSNELQESVVERERLQKLSDEELKKFSSDSSN